jgi:succinyl-CoA synthetase alpha subunit
MSILSIQDTKVIVQGLTGKTGTFHTEQALAYHGTQMVAASIRRRAARPGKAPGGASCRSSPPLPRQGSNRRQRLGDLRSAGRRGLPRSSKPSTRNPVHRLHHRRHSGADMVKAKAKLDKSNSRLIGPNCPGVMTPDECKIGIMPGSIFKKGSVGVLSRSGTLTYEAVFQTTNEGLGQTTAVGIGGDPVKGTEFIDILEMFLDDDETNRSS